MRKTFYEKVGRRYKPIFEYDQELMDSYPKGAHLVVVHPGRRSVRYSIEPALAPMIAAGRFAEDVIVAKIVDASAMRPSKAPITKEQQQAWQEVQQAFGDERYSICTPSARDIAEAGVAAMQQEAEKLLKNPTVRSAYEQFMLLCELVKNNEANK